MNLGVEPLIWKGEELFALDQRYLPHREELFPITDLQSAWNSINFMVVRGAPLIGFTGIFGMAFYVKGLSKVDLASVRKDADYLITARPTAVNLKYEVDNCVDLIEKLGSTDPKEVSDALFKFGHDSVKKLYDDNLTMAKYCESYLREKLGDRKYKIATICNTGTLACGTLGTALGTIQHLHNVGLIDEVYAFETRPYLQGSRLTSYELLKSNIPHKVVVEGAMSHLIKTIGIDAAFAGADRIAANGDTANKIGTSTLSIVCKNYDVPFCIYAPTSSFDLNTPNGAGIEIELRPEEEVTHVQGKAISAEGVKAYNPSFDVTDARLIDSIFCEKGQIKTADGDTPEKFLK